MFCFPKGSSYTSFHLQEEIHTVKSNDVEEYSLERNVIVLREMEYGLLSE